MKLWRWDPIDVDLREIVVAADWGYVDPHGGKRISEHDETLYQVSLTYFPYLREWAILYFVQETGMVYWYGDVFHTGEDPYAVEQALEAWEDHLDQLLDAPYTKPTE